MQRGCLERFKRKRGPDVWQFRWSEASASGARLYHKKALAQSSNILMRPLRVIGDGLFQLDAPNLYLAMTRGSKLLVLCSKTMLLNPRRK
jgi:hypothetical protein